MIRSIQGFSISWIYRISWIRKRWQVHYEEANQLLTFPLKLVEYQFESKDFYISVLKGNVTREWNLFIYVTCLSGLLLKAHYSFTYTEAFKSHLALVLHLLRRYSLNSQTSNGLSTARILLKAFCLLFPVF